MPIITKTNTNKEDIHLSLEGPISNNDTPVLANHFVGNLNKVITLDMKDMSSLDTFTIHMLRAANSIVKKYGGKIVIMNIPKDLADKPFMRVFKH